MAMNDSHNHAVSIAEMRGNYQETVPRIPVGLTTKMSVFASAYSNVYRISTRSYSDVCVKALRVLGDLSSTEARDRQITKVMREMTTWVNLRHTNILPFLGYSELDGEHFIGLVSEWKQEGHILTYVGRHPETDRLSLLIGCADGLEYLHGCNVVHGDLKCQNVLITLSSDGTPIPLICDFGTSRIMGMRGYTTQSLWGTQGFLAPELIEESESARAIPTSDSDVWAFGVMAFQLFIGQENISTREKFNPNMKFPSDVRGLTSPVWSVMLSCWRRQPSKRPRAEKISRGLRVVQTTGELPERDCILM